MRRIAEEIEELVELGLDGRLIALQLAELTRASRPAVGVVTDYVAGPRGPSVRAGGLGRMRRLDGGDPRSGAFADLRASTAQLEAMLSPRGYRGLQGCPALSASLIERLVARFGSLSDLLSAQPADLESVEGVGQARARSIRDGLARLAEASASSARSVPRAGPRRSKRGWYIVGRSILSPVILSTAP